MQNRETFHFLQIVFLQKFIERVPHFLLIVFSKS
jgi:hypothetical protein